MLVVPSVIKGQYFHIHAIKLIVQLGVWSRSALLHSNSVNVLSALSFSLHLYPPSHTLLKHFNVH